jgi:hypothetical protein
VDVCADPEVAIIAAAAKVARPAVSARGVRRIETPIGW